MNETVFPKDASVVVIGGGILGCSTLYHLAQSGIMDAILLERSQLTSGTTWHSAAQVRALRSSKNLTELIRYSFSFFDELEKETGQATGWMQTGSLSIATNQESEMPSCWNAVSSLREPPGIPRPRSEPFGQARTWQNWSATPFPFLMNSRRKQGRPQAGCRLVHSRSPPIRNVGPTSSVSNPWRSCLE